MLINSAQVNKSAFVKTKNVKALENEIENLMKRPVNEVCGLMLVWGAPGLGKTRATTRLAFDRRFMQIRLDATTTQKSFLMQLNEAMAHKFALPHTVFKGSTDKLFNEIIEKLNDNVNATIVIDEIDYAFKKRDLLGTIRDIVDESPFTNIILVGMAEAKDKLEAANAHYFDRCGYWCEFKPLDWEDTKAVCEGFYSSAFNKEFITRVHKKTRGVTRHMLRHVIAFNRVMERRKKADKQNIVEEN